MKDGLTVNLAFILPRPAGQEGALMNIYPRMLSTVCVALFVAEVLAAVVAVAKTLVGAG